MGLYTQDHLDDANIKAIFMAELEANRELGWWRGVSMPIDSDRDTETHKWVGHVPAMREWVGGRHEETLNKFSLTVRNKPYEATLPISVSDLRRDKTGLLQRRIGQLAQEAVTHPNGLLTTLYEAGTAGSQGLAYDGQFFFDTDHNESGSNQSNDLTTTEVPSADVGNANAATAAEAAAIITETVGHMMTLTNDKGNPINQTAMDVEIHVSKSTHWAAFNNAVQLNNLTQATDNPVRGLSGQGWQFKAVLNPRLAAANNVYFFLKNAGSGSPFVLQEELPITTEVLGSGSDEEFFRNRHMFGVQWNGAAGYLFWQAAAIVPLS